MMKNVYEQSSPQIYYYRTYFAQRANKKWVSLEGGLIQIKRVVEGQMSYYKWNKKAVTKLMIYVLKCIQSNVFYLKTNLNVKMAVTSEK